MAVRRLLTVGSLAVLLAALVVFSAGASAPAAQAAGPCTSGTAYDPACDVDRNGIMDVRDVLLTAGHWGHTGTWSADYWSLYGNPGIQPGVHVLGTTDPASLTLVVDAAPTLRLEVAGPVPNLVAGEPANQVTSGAWGAVIGGGGAPGEANRVTDFLGTVAGGAGNRAGDDTGTADSAVHATVGGGFHNVAGAEASTVGGGESNTAGGDGSTVGGGIANQATAGTSTVGGGANNQAQAGAATVGGGESNTVDYHAGTVAGGSDNQVSGDYAVVGGGQGNRVTADYATVAGGGLALPSDPTSGNWVTDEYSTVGGGGANQAGDGDGDTTNAQYATVSGGGYNSAARGSAVGGGYANTTDGSYATIGGGLSNQIDEQTYYIDSYATIGGGLANSVGGLGLSATIAGGQYNRATAPLATVPGGYFASAGDYGQMAFASGRFGETGDAQASLFVLRGTTTNATPTNLYLDGAAAQELITIGEDRAMAVDILVVARSSDDLASAYRIEGLFKDNNGSGYIVGATTSLIAGELGLPTFHVIPRVVGNALSVEVTGPTNKTVRWVATVRTAEVAW